jgi:citrate lyase synthetase
MEFNSKDPNRALVKSQYESLFQGHSSEYKKYMKVIQKGMTDLTNQTYVNGGKYYS